MNALDEVLKRVDEAVARLERGDGGRSPTALRAEIDGLTLRVDAALAKARAARAALD
jgi:hypothetical protein